MAQQTTRTIEVYPKQRDFLNCPQIYKAFVAGIGAGKSFAGAYDMIRRAKPNRLYMVVAPTYTLLGDSTFRSFLKVADEHLGLIGPGDVKRSAPPIMRLATGAEILFRSGDEPDKLRGPNLSGMWLDEASLMHEDVFKVSIGRLRQEGEQGWLTATFTPKGMKHWTYKTFALGKENTAMFRARTRENPFNPPEYEAILRTQYSRAEAQQELDGMFLEEGGNHFNPRVWPRYVFMGDAWSLRDEPIRTIAHQNDVTILVAIDISLGLKDTSDHTALIAAGLLRDGRVLILEVINERINYEHVGRELDRFCEKWQPHTVAGDDDNLSKAMLLEYRRWPHIPEVRCLPIQRRAKLLRADAAIIHGENKRIYLPQNATWLDNYCDQLSAFTGIVKAEEDDMVDATGIIARLVRILRGNAGLAPRPHGGFEVLTGGKSTW